MARHAIDLFSIIRPNGQIRVGRLSVNSVLPHALVWDVSEQSVGIVKVEGERPQYGVFHDMEPFPISNPSCRVCGGYGCFLATMEMVE